MEGLEYLRHHFHLSPMSVAAHAPGLPQPTTVEPPPCFKQARLKGQWRRPVVVAHRVVGSVALEHLGALTAWPQWVQLHPDRVVLTPHGHDLTLALQEMNESLRRQGLIVAWRDERFALWDPCTGEALASLERASARFWGTLTLGAHCNGYVADAKGRPTHLWVARRSWSKATDPGKLDNLIGGGVPWNQSPEETVVREGWEEAGLRPLDMQGLRRGGVLELDRDVPEGRQWERLHVFDLPLPAGLEPCNQDGEVAELQLLPVEEAVTLALGHEMTVDAACVTLEFALRHGMTVPGTACQPLWVASHMNWPNFWK